MRNRDVREKNKEPIACCVKQVGDRQLAHIRSRLLQQCRCQTLAFSTHDWPLVLDLDRLQDAVGRMIRCTSRKELLSTGMGGGAASTDDCLGTGLWDFIPSRAPLNERYVCFQDYVQRLRIITSKPSLSVYKGTEKERAILGHEKVSITH